MAYDSDLNVNLVRESLRLMLGEEMPAIMAKEYITLAMLTPKVSYQTQIKDNVLLGGSNAQVRAVTADRSQEGTTETQAPFTLPIGDYAITGTIQVLKTLAVQAANTAPGELADLFRYQVQGKLREIMRTLNQLVFTGTGNAASAGIIGLVPLVESVAYAGITNARWSCIDEELALTSENLLRMERLIREGENSYDTIITTPAIVETYKGLFDEKRSFQVTNGTNPADLGVSTVSYNGRPIIDDTMCPAGHIYFVNRRGLELYTYVTGTSEDVMGLQMDVEPVPTFNQYLLEFEAAVIPQFVVKNRRNVARMVLPTPPVTP